MTDPPDGMITWSAPLVQNQYDNPDDLWLEQGTPLTADMLPSSLHTTVQFQGSETDAALALVWDLSAYDGRTEGEKVTLSGRFLDENGQTLLSAVPLTLTVHWYAPEILIVTDAVWKGETVPTVQLTVQNLPDPDDFWGEIWGEVSADGGQTWQRWDDEDTFFIVPALGAGYACVFRLPDETPRWFRIVAEDTWEHLCKRSEAFYLAYEEQEDSGGNRGGSTSPSAPDRTPAPPETSLPEVPWPDETDPEPEPDPPETDPAQDEPAQDATDTPEALPDTPASGAPSSPPASAAAPETHAARPMLRAPSGNPDDSAAPAPQAQDGAQPAPAGEEALSDTAPLPQADPDAAADRPAPPAAEPADATTLPVWKQILLGVCGVGLCAGAGLAATGHIRRRRRK